jgi:hypothetical protein
VAADIMRVLSAVAAPAQPLQLPNFVVDVPDPWVVSSNPGVGVALGVPRFEVD